MVSFPTDQRDQLCLNSKESPCPSGHFWGVRVWANLRALKSWCHDILRVSHDYRGMYYGAPLWEECPYCHERMKGIDIVSVKHNLKSHVNKFHSQAGETEARSPG